MTDKPGAVEGGLAVSSASARTRYHWSLRAMHWTIVVLVIGQYLTSFAIVRTHRPHLIGQHPSDFDLLQHTIHNRVGLLIVALMVLRLGLRWRMGVPTPMLPESDWRSSAARIVHHAFYVVLVLQGVTGAIATYFWWPMSTVHQICFKILLGLIALHVSAAVFNLVTGKYAPKRII